MATFGSIASAAPNVLFDPARVDAQVQGFQRNQLLMQNAQQDQQQQTYQRDTEARIAMARELVNLPEDQAAAAWGPARQRLVAGGLGRDLPDQFPGLERIKAVASSDLTTFERLKIEQQREASAALAGLFGGIPAAGGASMGGSPTPGYTQASLSAPLPSVTAPAASGGNVRTQNANYAQMRQEAMDTLEGEPLARRLAEISAAASAELTRTPSGTQYPANPGSTGAFAGMGAPAPGVPVLGSGQPPAQPAVATGGAQTPAEPASAAAAPPTSSAAGSPSLSPLISGGPLAGLTQEQATRIQAMSRIPGANPAALLSQVEAARQHNVTERRQSAQDDRQRRMDADRLDREDRRDTRAEEASRRADAAVARQEEAERRRAAREGIPPGYRAAADGSLEAIPGGPADPSRRPEKFTEGQANAALYADRMRQAEAIMEENPTGGQSWRDRMMGMVPGVGGYFVSPEYQKVEQAQRNFINAVLRRESGAAIAESEFESARKQYFPEPSDTPERLEQKRQTRIAAIEGVSRAAGPAYQPPAPGAGNSSRGGGTNNAPPTAGTVVDGYRFKGGNPAEQSNWEPA